MSIFGHNKRKTIYWAINIEHMPDKILAYFRHELSRWRITYAIEEVIGEEGRWGKKKYRAIVIDSEDLSERLGHNIPHLNSFANDILKKMKIAPHNILFGSTYQIQMAELEDGKYVLLGEWSNVAI